MESESCQVTILLVLKRDTNDLLTLAELVRGNPSFGVYFTKSFLSTILEQECQVADDSVILVEPHDDLNDRHIWHFVLVSRLTELSLRLFSIVKHEPECADQVFAVRIVSKNLGNP